MAATRRKTNSKRANRKERQFTVRGVRRDPVDIRKFSRALLLAQAEAERQAQAEHAAHRTTDQPGVTADDRTQVEGGGHA